MVGFITVSQQEELKILQICEAEKQRCWVGMGSHKKAVRLSELLPGNTPSLL